MPIVEPQSGTTVDEIADAIYRISTPLPPNPEMPSGFTFNRYLILDDDPLLYHTGLRQLFPLTRIAIESLIPIEKLRYVAFSHVEADECGALNDLLAVAPEAVPLCSDMAAMLSINDIADRAPRAMRDGETVSLGRHRVQWVATPHLPHAWECGHLFEHETSTLFCGDLFTQFGADHAATTEADILETSEEARAAMDYYAHARNTPELIEKLAVLEPKVLACMHGSAWLGNGSVLLRALRDRLDV
ncbi:MAG: MBL fold metallo-hydrolase [Alphaproteobacteria bacterium]